MRPLMWALIVWRNSLVFHSLDKLLGLKKPEETVEMDSVKTKVVFAILQLVFTPGTVLPTYFLYSNYILSCAYIMMILTWGTWNGACYYIEVFAETYTLKFVKRRK